MGYWDEAKVSDDGDYWSKATVEEPPKPQGKLARMMAETLPKSSEEQYTMDTAKENIFNAPGQYAGQKTQEATEPYLGKEGSRLAGAGVSGALTPTPGVGTAARIGYGVTSAIGEDIAGKYTDNPYVKAAAGFVAPLAAGQAGRSLIGAGDIAGGALEAEGEAKEGNVKAQEAYDEAKKITTEKQQKAFDTAGEEADKARAKAEKANAKAQEKFDKARSNFNDANQQALDDAGEVAEKARNEAIAKNQAAAKAKADLERQTATELAPAAKRAAIEQATGRTAAQTEAEVTMAQGPERIARNEQFRDNNIAPLSRWRNDWASRRDTLLEPIKDTRTEAPELLGAMDEVRDAAGKGGIVSGKIKSLYKRAHLVAGYPEGMEVFGGELTDEDLAGMSDDKREFYQNLRAGTRGQQPKVEDLLTLQSDANAVARSSKGIERRQAMAVVRGVDDTLAEIDPSKTELGAMSPIVKQLKVLNAEYRDHRINFPYKFEDAISGAARPIDAAKEIFDEPQRALDLYDLGNPEERQSLGRLYADAVHTNGTKFINPDHAKFLERAFPNTDLARPNTWLTLPDKEVSTAQVLNSSPDIAQQFGKRMDMAMAAELEKFSTTDPQQAAQRAALQSLMGDQPPLPPQPPPQTNPQQAGNQAGMAALQKNPPPPQPPPPQQVDPRQAGIQAAQSGRTASGSQGLAGLKSRFIRYGAVSAGLALTQGRVSPGIAGLGIFSAAELTRIGMMHAFQKLLEMSPKLASRFLDAMNHPTDPISSTILARGLAAAAISDVTGKNANQAAVGETLRPDKKGDPETEKLKYIRSLAP